MRPQITAMIAQPLLNPVRNTSFEKFDKLFPVRLIASRAEGDGVAAKGPRADGSVFALQSLSQRTHQLARSAVSLFAFPFFSFHLIFTTISLHPLQIHTITLRPGSGATMFTLLIQICSRFSPTTAIAGIDCICICVFLIKYLHRNVCTSEDKAAGVCSQLNETLLDCCVVAGIEKYRDELFLQVIFFRSFCFNPMLT